MDKIKRYIKNLFEIISIPSMSYLPGNLAFYLMLSIFPILTLLGVVASSFSIDINSVSNVLDMALPTDVADILNSFIIGKGFDTNIGIFMIIGFYLASNGADAIILASNNLYGFPNRDYVKRRIKAIFIIILIILLFIFMLGFLAFGNHILSFILNLISDRYIVSIISNLFKILKWPFSIFVIYFNIKLIYTIAPDWKILGKHTTKGAIFTTVGWILAIQIYSYWVNNFSNYGIFYGSLSNIVVLMLLTYIISYILVIGIAINVRCYEYKLKD